MQPDVQVATLISVEDAGNLDTLDWTAQTMIRTYVVGAVIKWDIISPHAKGETQR